jgi:hypothetical protein
MACELRIVLEEILPRGYQDGLEYAVLSDVGHVLQISDALDRVAGIVGELVGAHSCKLGGSGIPLSRQVRRLWRGG